MTDRLFCFPGKFSDDCSDKFSGSSEFIDPFCKFLRHPLLLFLEERDFRKHTDDKHPDPQHQLSVDQDEKQEQHRGKIDDKPQCRQPEQRVIAFIDHLPPNNHGYDIENAHGEHIADKPDGQNTGRLRKIHAIALIISHLHGLSACRKRRDRAVIFADQRDLQILPERHFAVHRMGQILQNHALHQPEPQHAKAAKQQPVRIKFIQMLPNAHKIGIGKTQEIND